MEGAVQAQMPQNPLLGRAHASTGMAREGWTRPAQDRAHHGQMKGMHQEKTKILPHKWSGATDKPFMKDHRRWFEDRASSGMQSDLGALLTCHSVPLTSPDGITRAQECTG